MESLYARDTPTAQERKLKLAERNQVIEDGQVTLKPQNPSNDEHPSETLDSLIETSTESNANTGAGNAATSTANSTDDTFGRKNPPEDDKKTEEARLAELSVELGSHSASNSEKTETKAPETSQAEEAPAVSTASEPNQPRRAGVASVPRKAKPAITINTGSGSTGVGAKRPPPTPVSPPTFSWNDILRVQNLIERCLQQYLSKVGQQKEMAAKGGKRLLHYSNMKRSSANRASAPCSLVTTATPTTLPPISMDTRTFLRTPIRSAKRTSAGKRTYNMNMYQLGNPSVGLNGTTSGMTTLPPPSPSPLPLPSPIKTDLDTHAFFT
ncbi:hypothetical protein GQ600_22150 [Phytophthora cactorum]|nr:hypothetical protein GQ600_22150 [Phytophthora cactorum]